jgi:hypothetical protein
MKLTRYFKKRRKKFANPISKIFMTIFLIILTIFSSCSSTLVVNNPSFSVSDAIVDFIREFYIANGIEFDFIIYGVRSTHIHDVINLVSSQLSKENVAITLRHIQKIDKWNPIMSQSAVILTWSTKNLRMLHHYTESSVKTKAISSQLKNIGIKRFKFLVYCEETMGFWQLKKHVNSHGSFSFNRPADFRFFEFFILNDHSNVKLIANLLYSPHHCEKFELKILNIYDKISRQWRRNLKNFDHFSNFFGCLLKFHTLHSSALYVKTYFPKMKVNLDKLMNVVLSKNVEFDGLLHVIVKVMAQRANFIAHFSISEHHDSNSNGFSVLGSKNFLSPHTTSTYFMIGMCELWNELFYYSMQTGETQMYFLVSENDYYTNYEKLLLPFDAATWTLLLLTFGLTFGVIFGLRLSPQWLRTVIFGKGERHSHVFNPKV